jgi:pimeloyl-ACP methyl ester carboxylesterase
MIKSCGTIAVISARFHKDKVILVAHSSGTNYGLIYAAEHPDKLIAYVGVGQMVDASKNFALQRDFDLEQAKARQDSALDDRETAALIRRQQPGPVRASRTDRRIDQSRP